MGHGGLARSRHADRVSGLPGPGPQSQWLLPDEIRARKNLDPISDVAEELGVASPVAAADDEPPETPSQAGTVPAMVPLLPADAGNENEPATNGAHP